MCVRVCVKGLGGVREVGFRGKLSHHLFIQSTEDGVSRERGGMPSTSRPGNTGGQELFFLLPAQFFVWKKKVEPMNKQPLLHWISCPHSMLHPNMSRYCSYCGLCIFHVFRRWKD